MPTKLKLLRGMDKHDPQRINRDEPEPESLRPPMPAWLDAMAKRRWKEYTKILLPIGVLTVADRESLAELCQVTSDLYKARRIVKKLGLLVTTKQGLIRNPACGEVHKLADRQLKLLAEFGMTPSSRTRIKVDKPRTQAIRARKRKA